MSFDVGHPFVRGDVEFVSLTVEGWSFVLHQIRKMIGQLRISFYYRNYSDYLEPVANFSLGIMIIEMIVYIQ